MPQVPYSPVPNVEPAQGGPGPISVSTPIEAFGGATAKAVQGLGAELGHVGDEIFKRAIAVQELNNRVEADKAVTDYMAQAGKLDIDLTTRRGQDAVKAYPDFQKGLVDTREQIRGTLSNPMAQRLYDSESRGAMWRTQFNGMRHVAEEQKQSVLSAGKAKQEILKKSVEDHPDSDLDFEAAKKGVDDLAETEASIMPGGSSPERIALLKQQGYSDIAYRRVISKALTAPNDAQKMLEDYKAKKYIWGDQLISAEKQVRGLIHTGTMATLADDILAQNRNADGTYKKSFVDMQEDAKSQAKTMYPDDPQIGVAAVGALDRQYNQRAHAQMFDDRKTTQDLYSFMDKGVLQTNLLPPNLVSKMSQKQIADYPAQALNHVLGKDKLNSYVAYRQLLGQYDNDATREDFMNTNLMGVRELSPGHRNELIKLQRAGGNGDPRVARAMQWIKGRDASVLDELYGSRSKGNFNQDDYNHFVGTLHDAIQAYQEVNGKAPGEKEVTKEIMPSVISTVTQPGFWSVWGHGTSNDVPFFKADIPDAVREAVKKKYPDRALTDDEIKHEWAQESFLKLFNDSKASKPKNQSRVP